MIVDFGYASLVYADVCSAQNSMQVYSKPFMEGTVERLNTWAILFHMKFLDKDIVEHSVQITPAPSHATDCIYDGRYLPLEETMNLELLRNGRKNNVEFYQICCKMDELTSVSPISSHPSFTNQNLLSKSCTVTTVIHLNLKLT